MAVISGRTVSTCCRRTEWNCTMRVGPPWSALAATGESRVVKSSSPLISAGTTADEPTIWTNSTSRPSSRK